MEVEHPELMDENVVVTGYPLADPDRTSWYVESLSVFEYQGGNGPTGKYGVYLE
jgi:hypothetical protein